MRILISLILFVLSFNAIGQIRLSDLNPATTLSNSDLFLLSQGNSSKKVTYSLLRGTIADSDTARARQYVRNYIASYPFTGGANSQEIEDSILRRFPKNTTGIDGLYGETAAGNPLFVTLDGFGSGGSGNLGNGFLKEQGDSTFVIYPDSTGTGKFNGMYYGTQNPSKTTRVNANGHFYLPQLTIKATGSNYGIRGESINNTAVSGYSTGTGQAAGFQSAGGATVLNINQSGISSSDPIIYIAKSQTGSDNSISDYISIIDNPLTSGTISGKAFTYKISSVERISLNPRATGTTVPYILASHNKVTGNLFEIKQQDRTKFSIDSSGYIHGLTPHAFSQFADSSITITLTQNNWIQITRPTSKTTWPATEFYNFTDSGDTITAATAGHYIVKYQINISGTDNKVYQYRIMRKNGTTSEVWRFEVTGNGTEVLRDVSSYMDLDANSKFWVEIRSISASPGTITLLGGQMRIYPIHLDL